MVDTVGRKLTLAREKRGLSLEEAAMQTRVRPSQLAALEADDYSSFGSNTYTRGFLLIYGKFLGVEVGEVAHQLESNNPISLSDYQYLNAVADEDDRALRAASRNKSKNSPIARSPAQKVERRRPSFAPLVVFVLLLGAGGYGFHLWLQAQRLEPGTGDTPSASATPEPVGERIAPATKIVAPATTNPVLSTTPAPAAAPRPATDDRAFLSSVATPSTAPTPRIEPPTIAPLPQTNELVIEPLKKTWVRIRKDDPAAEPVFDDVMYPKVGALKLKGARFWVEIREPDSLSLKKNGQQLAIQPPGAVIQ